MIRVTSRPRTSRRRRPSSSNGCSEIATRVVSLVPSATETLRALGVDPIACSRFCEQPDLPTVGGTKDPDVAAIVALRPDLVVMNDEENRVEDAQVLLDAGLRVHSMSPRSVADVGAAVRALGDAVERAVPTEFEDASWQQWLQERRAGAPASRRTGVVMVWRRPWMTLASDTYGSSVVDLLGIANVFGDSGIRYPEITLDEIAAYGPALVLLPDEPYPFRSRHLDEVAAVLASARIVIVDGQDLFWWGIRTPQAVARLGAQLSD